VSTPSFPVLTAPVPCVPTGSVLGCSYYLIAVNAAGASTPSRTHIALFRHSDPPTDLQAYTSSVDLGTGLANQAVSWGPPTNFGGLALTDYVVWACTTTSNSLCTNMSGGWTLIDDLTGNPPPTTTTHQCVANGRCAYEVWAKNQRGKAFAVAFAGSGGPTTLTGSSVPGHVDLQWLDPAPSGTFGHYVLFECSTSQICTNGSWTNVPGDAAPWTSVDLSGTATNTSFACGIGAHCMFRVGYVDGDGNIGGVTNAVTLTGQ
jgi:hypothetical protein